MITGVGTMPESTEDWTAICRCGSSEVTVELEAVHGAYAVHPTISAGRARGPGHTITHRASGFAVWHVRAFAEAIAVARWLCDNLLLPDDMAGVQQWKQQLTPIERTRLIVRLTEIAPREWVVVL